MQSLAYIYYPTYHSTYTSPTQSPVITSNSSYATQFNTSTKNDKSTKVITTTVTAYK